MEKWRKIGGFLKRYAVDILIVFFGTALSITIAILTSNYAVLVGIGETLFVELSLFAIRQETKSSFKEHINSQMLHTLEELKHTQVGLSAVSLAPLLAKKENQAAIQKEFDRIQKTLLELQDGKRRIYENDDLYKEQQQIVLNSSKNILAIHVVKDIGDLRRWDPDTMNRESSFYKALYTTFEMRKSKRFRKQRIIILPKWSISEIQDRYNKMDNEDPQGSNELGSDDIQIKEYHQVIERVVEDQKNLGFQVRFITATEALSAKVPHIYDSLIGDAKYGFEFSKSVSADVHAYAIESRDYIKEQIEIFEYLWKISKEWC